MAKKLTAATVAQAKPKPVSYELPDGGCPALRLLIHPCGAKSCVMRRADDRLPAHLSGRARLWRGGVGDLDNLCSEGIGTEFSTPLNHASQFGVLPLPPPHGGSIRHARNFAVPAPIGHRSERFVVRIPI
jgi:hypothetical protein